MTTFDVGDTVDDRFVIERIAAAGGMGTVYRAYDSHTGDHVALKVLNAASDPWRFALEARIARVIEHPFIVGYVAHGETKGIPYLALEWLEGEDLCARLQRGPLSLEESLNVVRRIARALCPLHAAGIIHRDLKPANVFLHDMRADRARLLDFGVARVMTRGIEDERTGTGVVIGTPLYMSPEQARGEVVDERTDVFALGTLLYECLVGRAPFATTGNIAMMLLRLLKEPAPRLSDCWIEVPAEVETLCAEMLDKDRANRPPHAGAVVEAIERIIPSAVTPRRASMRPRMRLHVSTGVDGSAKTDTHQSL